MLPEKLLRDGPTILLRQGDGANDRSDRGRHEILIESFEIAMGGSGIPMQNGCHRRKAQIDTARWIVLDGVLRQLKGEGWIVEKLVFNSVFREQGGGVRVGRWFGHRIKTREEILILLHGVRIEKHECTSLREAVNRGGPFA